MAAMPDRLTMVTAVRLEAAIVARLGAVALVANAGAARAGKVLRVGASDYLNDQLS
jgi:hypothetical protein